MRFCLSPGNVRWFAALLVILCTQLALAAQNGSKNSDVDPHKLWTFTKDEQKAEQQIDQTEGPVVDRKTFARVGFDGHYLPYLQVDNRRLEVNATTIRTTERSYAIDPEGHKALTQVVREDKQEVGGGASKIERTTSTPDANGHLRVVRRESETLTQKSLTVQQTDTTILATNPNGGAANSSRIEGQETRKDEHTVAFQRTTLLPDGKGGWLVSEVHEGTIREDAGGQYGDHYEEDRTSQPDAAGKMVVVKRVVSRDTKIAPGEKQHVVETYSASASGQSLELSRRVTTKSWARSDGSQLVEEQVEEQNSLAPGEGLQVTQKKTDIVIPGIGAAGRLDNTQDFGGNGSVSIDLRNNSNPTVNVDTGTPQPH
jgi:hypothetical protein